MSDDEKQRRRASSTFKQYDPDNGWSDDIENICEAIRNNSATMSEKHKKLYMYYNGQLKYYKIPVIIISGFNSVIAVGLQPYLEQGLISASNCLLALLCGIIGSIELFLGIQTSMETEMAASKSFYLLSVNIYRTLSLERIHRGHPGKEYLEEVYTEYSKLFETSALIQSKMKDSLAAIPGIPGGVVSRTYSPGSTPSGSPVEQKKSFRGIFSRKTKSPTPSYTKSLPMKMMDPSEMLELGQAGMLRPGKIQGMGNDLLSGKGFMKDLAPLQENIRDAVGMASSALQLKEDASKELEKMRLDMIEEAKSEAARIREEALEAGAEELKRIREEALRVKTETEEVVSTELSVANAIGAELVNEVINESLKLRQLEEGE
jgi:hypothetical protein